MNCPKCQTELSGNSTFCPNCGEEIPAADTPKKETIQSQLNKEHKSKFVPNSNENKIKNKNVAIVLGLIATFFSIIVKFWQKGVWQKLLVLFVILSIISSIKGCANHLSYTIFYGIGSTKTNLQQERTYQAYLITTEYVIPELNNFSF